MTDGPICHSNNVVPGWESAKRNSISANAPRLLILCLFLILAGAPLSAISPWNAVGDTLTVIQIPILNVPAIHIPGETLAITCIAPSATASWQASLVFGNRQIPLTVTSSQYLSNPARWELAAAIPSAVPVFELYDLRVTASGGIDDTTANAVQLVPSRKTNYYFVHVTDAHMPTRIFYPDTGFNADSTAVDDFRAVLEDINLIRPEFVLLTGDIINEGELEGFAGQYWYGWVQRVLAQFEVPCFLVAGNHDIGGWNDTPPPTGSSRRNWWRYFGWPWLDNPDTNWGRWTQDYSFVYGSTHFIGLEAYDNYDNFRANIYGGQSFIYSQMVWLNQQLQLHPDKTRVLFHHYDFSEQLDLAALDLDMALWGHVHYNSGSTSVYPYNLATRSTCNGNRAYRVVRVNGSSLQPYSSIYAGSSGATINAVFSPSNNATADSVRCVFVNGQSLSFENSLLKFNMPPGNWDYAVYNGVLEQVDRGPARNVCYVRVNLAANSTQYVSVAAHASPADDPALAPHANPIKAMYPNPFRQTMQIVVESRDPSPVSITVHNLRGQTLRRFGMDGSASSDAASWNGATAITWDGKDSSGRDLPAGIYIIRASTAGRDFSLKAVKL